MEYPVNNNQPFTPFGVGKPTFTPSAPRKKTVEFTAKDYVFTALFAVASVLMAFIGITEGMALGFTVSYIIFAVILAVYLFSSGKANMLSVSCIAAAILSSIAFSLYGEDRALLTAAAVIIAATAGFAVSVSGIGIDSFGDIMRAAHAAVMSPLEHAAVPLRSLFASGKKKTASQALLAALISIPFLAVLIALLSSYDAAFAGLIKFTGRLLGKIIIKILLSAVLFAVLFTYAVNFRFGLFRETNSHISDVPSKRFVKNIFTLTFLGLISALYLGFIVSQFAYLFNSFKGLLPANFTFSEYARRGFFEAEAIAFINLALMLFFTRFSARREDGKITLPVKILFIFISLFSLFLIITAGLKMSMYIRSYGLTVLRLTTSVFMLASAAFVIAFLIKVIFPEAKPVRYAAVFSLILITALSLAGIDRTVADYNVSAYLGGRLGSVDVTALSELAPDSAIPYVIRLTEVPDTRVATQAKEAISYMCLEGNWAHHYISYTDKIQLDKVNIFADSLFRSRTEIILADNWIPVSTQYSEFRPPYIDRSYADISDRAIKKLGEYSGVDFDTACSVYDAVDNHDGFFGDGTSFVEIHYSDDSVEKRIAESERWKPLPVSENIDKIIYGESFTEIRDYGIPKISNGYYFFYDRSEEATDPYNEYEFYDRYSYNFTCAIYDADTDVLYYVEGDT